MTDRTTAAAAGTWTLGDRTVNRLGFGAMRLTANADGTPSDRDRAVAVLRTARALGVNHVDTAATISTSSTCASTASTRWPSTSARSPTCAPPV